MAIAKQIMDITLLSNFMCLYRTVVHGNIKILAFSSLHSYLFLHTILKTTIYLL